MAESNGSRTWGKRLLLWLAVVLLALGIISVLAAGRNYLTLLGYRIQPPPFPKTAQEDYATNPYWVDFFMKAQLVLGLPLTGAGIGLWLVARRKPMVSVPKPRR